jgi:hypothetical protein
MIKPPVWVFAVAVALLLAAWTILGFVFLKIASA